MAKFNNLTPSQQTFCLGINQNNPSTLALRGYLLSTKTTIGRPTDGSLVDSKQPENDDTLVDFLHVDIGVLSKMVKDTVEEYFEAVFDAETLEEDSDTDDPPVDGLLSLRKKRNRES